MLLFHVFNSFLCDMQPHSCQLYLYTMLNRGGNTMNKNIFSKRLKDLREEKSITKTQLAEKIGCDQPKISKLENPKNTTFPSVDNLIALADYFGVSIDYLLGVEKKEQNQIQTFADIIKRLFEIDEVTDISLNQHTKEYFSYDFDYPEPYDKDVYQLGFEPHGSHKFLLNDFMKEWESIKKLSENIDSNTWNRIYELWKKDQLERHSERYLDGFMCIPDGIDEELPFS